ncbi:chemotaxis protein CheB [Thioclava atlantica]|uniref:chemotaxis protein CheB n=1 Tax=Thioclava atlantica TaxID=1317124 RepID=UPI0005703EE9|nr:chemotaxis protein CheB [Thioclava atlantica]
MTEGAQSDLYVVGIGASAGGLEALRELLEAAPQDDPCAYVIVQHLDPNHESLLAELLDRSSALAVKQAEDGELLSAGHVYTIPPGSGLELREGRLHLSPFNQPRGLRRPIDDFFESLAQDRGPRAVGVILSGTGTDGTVGLRSVKEHGGFCIAQDASARYDSMPNSAVATGMVDVVCPPSEVIARIAGYREVDPEQAEAEVVPVSGTLEEICAAVTRLTGHDFTLYKNSTLERRIQRRMQVVGLVDAKCYLERLDSEPGEAEALLGDLLINVTRFFRDQPNFEVLREKVIEPLVAQAEPGSELRIWVPGCSSGEEAYTLGMLVDQVIIKAEKALDFQIFGTDIDERMLSIARAGRYPVSALLDLPEEMRDLYTIGRDGSFQITTALRERVRFSSHSLIKDPPFSRLDLISCRNLLIYFGDKLQARVLPIFHYALNRGGYLFLGPSETVGRHDSLFAPLDAQMRIFKTIGPRSPYPTELSTRSDPFSRLSPSRPKPNLRRPKDWTGTVASNRILDLYAPATMQVDRNGAILASTGRLGRYIEVDPSETGQGYAQSVARAGLREALSALIREAGSEGQRKVIRDVEVISETGSQKVDVLADPLSDETILIVFRDRAPFAPSEQDDFDEIAPSESHVQVLEAELRATRTRLRSTVEELETANEELKSSNEEMMSMNEELQSTNEELATVNDELKTKVEELSAANADLRNIFDSKLHALVTVDRKKRLRNFTDGAAEVIRLRNSDQGRPLSDVQSSLDQPEVMIGLIDAVLGGESPGPVRVSSQALGRIWSLAATPYTNARGEVAGATLIFTDVTKTLRLENELLREGQRLRLALEISNVGVWSLDPRNGEVEIDGTIAEFYELDEPGTFALDEILGRIDEADRAKVSTEIESALAEKREFDCSFAVNLPSGGQRYLRGLGRQMREGGVTTLLGLNVDITSEQEAAKMRELLLREMNHRVKNLFSVVSGMLRISGRSAETPRELVDDVSGRINALARSHDLARTRQIDATIPMGELLETTLAPYGEKTKNFRLEGPEVTVSTSELTALALIFHEWSTNAAKYGVLGPIAGELDICWGMDAGGAITVEWREVYDEPLETVPETAGFGSTLVNISAQQIGAKVEMDQTSEWRSYNIRFTNAAESEDA